MQLHDIFGLLADHNRLRIINLLLQQKLCVCEIEKVLSATQSNVSRHLNRLRMAGVLSSEKKSQWIYYSVDSEFLKEYPKLIEFLKEEFLKQEMFQKDLDQLKELKGKGEVCTLSLNKS